MAAIKKLVYEDKTLTMDQVIQAMDADFKGYEEVQKALVRAPKYGNDDDYVDLILADFINEFSLEVMSKKSIKGQYCDPGVQPVQANVGFGNLTGALPSRRKACEPLADAQSAFSNTDINGPTAAVRSYGKLNFPILSNGSLINMWINHSEVVEK